MRRIYTIDTTYYENGATISFEENGTTRYINGMGEVCDDRFPLHLTEVGPLMAKLLVG